MHRTLACILAMLLMTPCFSASARVTQGNPLSPYQFTPAVTGATYTWDEKYTPLESQSVIVPIREGMQKAGRTVYGLGLTACAVDPTGQFACVLVAGEDALQMTILEQSSDKAWQAAAWNDTIPAGEYNWQSLRWEQSAVWDGETGGLITLDAGCFRLSREQFTQNGMGREDQSTEILDFGQDASGVWRLYAIRDAFFAEAVNGRCPYLTLSWSQDQWMFRVYEMIQVGYAWERSDCLGELPLTTDDLAGRDAVNDFDYPAIVTYLRYLQSLKPSKPSGAVKSTATPQPSQREEALIAAAERLASHLALPDTVYYNPLGGLYYHTSMICDAVDVSDWPLSPIPMEKLSDSAYAELLPCPRCCEDAVLVYYNPVGGKYYHASATCPAVSYTYWPLTPVDLNRINDPNFINLLPCPRCGAPERPAVPKTPDFVYYNPNGGRYYHAVDDCVSVSEQYLPLSPIPFDQLNTGEYSRLVPCPRCNPVNRSFP